LKRTKLILIIVIVLLVALFAVGSWQNSVAIQSLSIRVNQGVAEHMDHTLLGFGAEHRLPDYKVKLRVSRKLLAYDLGTKLNTSATNWIQFPVNAKVPFRQAQEIIIIEDDTVENDVLERLHVTGVELRGSTFQCRIDSARRFEVGMDWFFDTPIGKAIAVGITITILFLILRSVA
jgi:hypothetical protein